LQCVLAAKILTVDFVVCTLAVKKNQGRFRHVGSDHSLVSPPEAIDWRMFRLDHDRFLPDSLKFIFISHSTILTTEGIVKEHVLNKLVLYKCLLAKRACCRNLVRNFSKYILSYER
jgi:hypothetical protein